MRLSPPAPEVQYLPAIFRKIQNGDIRIPAFQRDFVWSHNQVLSLLESVYRGFPIGSILFWRVDSRLLRVESSVETVFPNLPEKFPLSYVLDGLQRLSALYGCFHWQSVNRESLYNVLFDLDQEEFVHYREGVQPDHYLQLSRIFSPKDFLGSQSALSKKSNADQLLDIAVKLHSSFQEYMVPTVTIFERDVEEVVEIFERINSTGTRLDTVDFLRAVTWSEAFDLNDALSVILDSADDEGFIIPDETAIKIFAMSLKKDPTPEAMLQLRNLPAIELKSALGVASGSLGKVLRFLKQQCSIFSYDFVPYEGQLLLLVKYAMSSGPSFESNVDAMRKWFICMSLNEGYRGKPDSYLVRDMKQVERFARGDSPPLTIKLSISEEDFLERYFTRGKALSAAVANLFTSTDTLSIYTGELIQPSSYMMEFKSNNYGFIVPLQDLKKVLGDSLRTNRILSNILVLNADESRQFKIDDTIELILGIHDRLDNGDSILKSQMITREALDFLKTGRFDEFLRVRALIMFDQARSIIV